MSEEKLWKITASNYVPDRKTVELVLVPDCSITGEDIDMIRLGDYREWPDGLLWPCDGTINSRIEKGERIWRLANNGKFNEKA